MRPLPLLALVVLAGCSGMPDPEPDAGATVDAGATTDAGDLDAGLPEVDASVPDAGTPDAGLPDAGPSLPFEVMTTTGPVLGYADAGVESYLGIPYAAPPVGPLRWKPTEPHAPWTEPRDATQLSAICPQDSDRSDGGSVQSEDCLYLNVWTPRADPAAKRPVMVFIHGGGFKNGSGSSPTYLGSTLPARDVVLVTFNYRLGILGFLAHPWLTAESAHQASGNYGLLDQQAALQWVHDNIAAFGGDPAQVTLFGESAGSISVCTHLVAPASEGLFRRGIGESGPCVITRTTLAAAEVLGAGFAQQVSCQDLACLRGLTVEQVTAVPASPPSDFGLGIATPNVDGWVLPEAPAVALAAGHVNTVDGFIGGVNRDEATLFTIGHPIDTQAALDATLAGIFPHHVADLEAMYLQGTEYKKAYDDFATDLLFVCPTKQQLLALEAAGVPTFAYRFEKLTAVGAATGLGVFHGSELPFVFGTGPLPGANLTLSNRMQAWWTGFAKTGTPGLPWTGFAGDHFLRIDDAPGMEAGLRTTQCAAIAQWSLDP